VTTPPWYPDERAHAGPEHLDAALVASYDAKTRLDLGASLELLRRNGLDPHTTFVDLGCGTGLLAAAAAPEAHRVVGVDPSPAMLEAARRRSGAVEWVETGLLTYEPPGEADERIEEWLAAAPSDPAAGWTREELETRVRDEHATYSWLLESLLERAGIEIRERQIRRGIYATYVCVRR
jgi:hypothetical protein